MYIDEWKYRGLRCQKTNSTLEGPHSNQILAGTGLTIAYCSNEGVVPLHVPSYLCDSYSLYNVSEEKYKTTLCKSLTIFAMRRHR